MMNIIQSNKDENVVGIDITLLSYSVHIISYMSGTGAMALTTLRLHCRMIS